MTSLVVTDLDGTLWDKYVVSDETKAGLQELERRSIPVLVATARASSEAKRGFVSNGIDVAAVVLNGALGREASSWNMFYSNPFDSDALETILSTFDDFNVMPIAFLEQDGRDLVSGISTSSAPEFLAWNERRFRSETDLAKVCRSHPVYMFSTVGYRDGNALSEIARHLMALGIPCVASPDKAYGGSTIDVLPIGISKWAGVLRFCERHNLDLEDVLVVGDGDNDVELFENAKFSSAMYDSTPKILDLADVRLPEGDGGWAAILRYV